MLTALRAQLLSRRAAERTGLLRHCRGLASRLPRQGQWHDVPAGERSAWEALGWTEASWAGCGAQPLSSMQRWDELSNLQQAAAQHGLGWQKDSWDEQLHSGDVVVQTEEAAAAAPAAASEAGGNPFQSALRVAGKVAPLVGSALAKSNHPALKLAGSLLSVAPSMADAMAAPVVVDGVETTLYLDDSGSMSFPTGVTLGTRLDEGRRVLSSLAPLLAGTTRVLKFGSSATVLVPREEETEVSGALVSLAWDGSSGGTYMWKMIEDDVCQRYQPGAGKLRLVVVTDGHDTLSPSEYNGVQGMNPMMRKLLRRGFDIEWHIVVLGKVDSMRSYESLSAATGGSFLAVDSFDPDSPKASAFLDAVWQSGPQERFERQRRYELDVDTAERFDWYTALPPPSR